MTDGFCLCFSHLYDIFMNHYISNLCNFEKDEIHLFLLGTITHLEMKFYLLHTDSQNKQENSPQTPLIYNLNYFC